MALSLEEKKTAEMLKKSGKTTSEVLRIIANQRAGLVQKQPEIPADEPSFLSRMGADITKRGEQVAETLTTPAATPLEAVQLGTQATAQTFGGITDTIANVIKSVPGGERALDAIGGVTSTAFKALTDKLASTKFFQEAAAGTPEGGTLETALKTAGGAGEIAGSILAAEGIKTSAQKTAELGTQAARNTGNMLSEFSDDVQKMSQETLDYAQNLYSKGILPEGARTKLAGATAEGQLKTSAERLREAAPLQGGGAAMRKPLIDTYEDFVKQETKHLGDIKQDPAISLVGNRIGDEFNTVVKLRREAGKTMSSELEKTATVPVNTRGAFTTFQQELLDNGASYDAIKKKLSAGPESKFASTDRTILEKYASELQKLGSTPNMRSLDAFISRIPNEIKALKSTQGINFITNAERLISNNLRELRDALGTVGSPEYIAARQAYSELSNFVKEGSRFLGKVTQSGDFARDASLAKSAVQSVLNNGKKDWLIELERLTGYPALDDSVMALQAMKDLGDPKGGSLLELLAKDVAEGSIPTSKTGIIDSIIGIGKRAVTGSPVEQTRAYLRSLTE